MAAPHPLRQLQRPPLFWPILGLSLSLILHLVACSSPPASPTATNPPPTATAAPSLAPSPTNTLTPQPSPTAPAPSPTPRPASEICSPLEGIPLSDLKNTIANPFLPPASGSDDPHQGVDFADIEPQTRISLEGRPVFASLRGTVAATIPNRFPYGNSVLVETPLEHIPPGWVESLQLPAPAAEMTPHPSLTCPDVLDMASLEPQALSLYIIYAHLLDTPTLEVGEIVTCGMPLGAIGSSGNALNPHLHFETRVGPSGARFGSMAHYETRATPEEMAFYCLWRVSGKFPLVDPLAVLALAQ